MEIIDVVDEDDKVIGKLSVEEAFEQKAIHRIVFILISNKKGELLLQKRSNKVKYFPGAWHVSAGGHVKSGEEYEDAAMRELFEELRVKLKLDFYTKEFYTDNLNGTKKFIEVYKGKSEGPFDKNSEVEAIEFCSVKKIRRMIEDGEEFTPELLMILKNYYRV